MADGNGLLHASLHSLPVVFNLLHLTQHCLWGYRWYCLLHSVELCSLGTPRGFQRKDLSSYIRCRGAVGRASWWNHATVDVSFQFNSSVSKLSVLLLTTGAVLPM